eukprot:gene12021-8275_t
MVNTLYFVPNPEQARGQMCLVAAAFANVPVQVKACTYGVENETEEYMNNCSPCGRYPVLQTDEGYIFETHAIVRHFGRLDASGMKLYGSTPFEASQVDMWLDFAVTEITNANKPFLYNFFHGAPVPECALATLEESLAGLERWMETRTFLVGERLTIADIAVAFALQWTYRMNLQHGEALAKKFKGAFRLYNTVMQQPKTVEAPKEEKKVEKVDKKKPAKKDDDDEDDAPKEEKKKPNPLDLLPPATFNNDTRTVAAPYFFDKFDAKGFTCFWCRYKYNDENKMQFMTANLVRGWFQRMEHTRKYAFGVALIVGESTKHDIVGFWVFRGQGMPEIVSEVVDTELFDWEEIKDINAEKAKITDYLCWEGPTIDKPVLEGKCFNVSHPVCPCSCSAGALDRPSYPVGRRLFTACGCVGPHRVYFRKEEPTAPCAAPAPLCRSGPLPRSPVIAGSAVVLLQSSLFHAFPLPFFLSASKKKPTDSTMVNTLYFVPNPEQARGQMCLVAAAFANVPVQVKACTYGVENETEEYMNNCSPCGRYPVLQTDEGYIFETHAIVRHFGRLDASGMKLYGSTPFEASQVDMWLDFAVTEITNANKPFLYNFFHGAPVPECALATLEESLAGLERWMETRTFLVGERLTIADIAVAFALQWTYRMNLQHGEALAKKFKGAFRLYNTVMQQPKTVEVLKAQGATFGPVKAPKEEKKVEKVDKKKPAKKDDDDEDDAPKEEKKKPNPLDLLPPATFNNDTRTVAAPYFFDKFDAKGFTCFWCRYKYNDENKMQFMTANLVRGWFQRMEHTRKYAFGVALIVGESTKHDIVGFWIVSEVVDTELFDWEEIKDINAEKAKITDYLCWEGPTIDKPVLEGKCFNVSHPVCPCSCSAGALDRPSYPVGRRLFTACGCVGPHHVYFRKEEPTAPCAAPAPLCRSGPLPRSPVIAGSAVVLLQSSLFHAFLPFLSASKKKPTDSTMVNTLYFVPNPEQARGQMCLVAAAFANVPVQVKACTYGVENETEEYMNNCSPCGRYPVLQTDEGYIFETHAIVRHFGRLDASGMKLYGSTPFEASQVDMWIDFAVTEITNANKPFLYNFFHGAPVPECALATLEESLAGLERWMETRTFLVGERLTIADIAVAFALQWTYRMNLQHGEALAKKFKGAFRLYNTVMQQPKTVEAPKEEKKVEKVEKKKPAKKDDDDEDDAPKEEKKKPNPLDLLPPSDFVLDAFKREYSNNDTRTVAAPYFFDKFDAKGFTCFWCRYKYNDENKMQFMTANLVRGWFQRMEHTRKYAFGVALIVGESTKHDIVGFWVFRGQGMPEIVSEVVDTELFDWEEIKDINAEKAKITDYLCWEGPTIDKPVLEGKCFNVSHPVCPCSCSAGALDRPSYPVGRRLFTACGCVGPHHVYFRKEEPTAPCAAPAPLCRSGPLPRSPVIAGVPLYCCSHLSFTPFSPLFLSASKKKPTDSTMVNTLYFVPNPEQARGQMCLVAAAFANVPVQVKACTYGVENETEEYMNNCSPCGRYPVLQTDEGYIFETHAIVRHFGRLDASGMKLYGSTPFEASQVDMWIDFAVTEITNANKPFLYNFFHGAPVPECALATLEESLAGLERWMETRTFLVGERLTIADIAVAFALQWTYRMNLQHGEALAKKFKGAFRLYNTVMQQPKTVEVLKAQGATFGPVKAPKEEKKVEKVEKKKPAKKDDDDEDDAPKEEKKKPNPLDLLPPSDFVLDAFKREYSNNDTRTVAAPYFFDKFDAKGFTCFWCRYKYNDENKMQFMTANLVRGWFQRMEHTRKYAFGHDIVGFWVFRGQGMPEIVSEVVDTELFDWEEIKDINAEKAKITDYLCWEGPTIDKPVLEGKCFK